VEQAVRGDGRATGRGRCRAAAARTRNKAGPKRANDGKATMRVPFRLSCLFAAGPATRTALISSLAEPSVDASHEELPLAACGVGVVVIPAINATALGIPDEDPLLAPIMESLALRRTILRMPWSADLRNAYRPRMSRDVNPAAKISRQAQGPLRCEYHTRTFPRLRRGGASPARRQRTLGPDFASGRYSSAEHQTVW